MYRKALGLLVLGSWVFMACFLCVRGIDEVRLRSGPAGRLKLGLWEVEEKARDAVNGDRGAVEIDTPQGEAGAEGDESEQVMSCLSKASAGGNCLGEAGQSGVGITEVAVSGQRVVDFAMLEQRYVYQLSEEEVEVLLRIVEAEAGNEDEDGKLLVANVVLNRMCSEQFPDTVTEVVFQRENGVTQFSPVSNGSYYRVEVSDETASAVERALMGEDISEGALYFAARKYASGQKMKWFDEHLTYLFLHGGHEFFK